MNILIWVLIILIFLILCIGALIIFWIFSWNIPVVVLRFVGNKGRPTLIVTKGKKRFRAGVPRLFVKGYKKPIRDFQADFYYPTTRGKFGGLILWEFEDDYLTPCIPSRVERKLSIEQKRVIAEANRILAGFNVIGFAYNEKTHFDLKVKAIDDVDIEFMIEEIARVAQQYMGGLREFLMKYAGHIVVLIVAICLMVGFIVWLDKSPEFAARCAATAQGTILEGIKAAAEAGGIPAG